VLAPMEYEAAMDRVLAGHDGSALDVWRGAILHLWMDRFGVPGIADDVRLGRPSSQSPRAA
jgi:hypothetical protein